MRGTDRRSSRHARRYAGLAVAAVIALLATACSSGSHSTASPAQSKARASASAKAHAAELAKDLRITPADGSHGAIPADGITVTAVAGKVTSVTVRTTAVMEIGRAHV